MTAADAALALVCREVDASPLETQQVAIYPLKGLGLLTKKIGRLRDTAAHSRIAKALDAVDLSDIPTGPRSLEAQGPFWAHLSRFGA